MRVGWNSEQKRKGKSEQKKKKKKQEETKKKKEEIEPLRFLTGRIPFARARWFDGPFVTIHTVMSNLIASLG